MPITTNGAPMAISFPPLPASLRSCRVAIPSVFPLTPGPTHRRGSGKLHGMSDETPKKPADDDNEPGAEGGSSKPAARPPAAPADDDAPLGDTDQHSDADA